MAKVTAPGGQSVTVRRWWWRTLPWETGFATIDAVIFLIVLPFMLMWPVWLVLKWCGVPWTVLVEHDGTEIARERVRGWRASGARIEEIAAAVQSGAMPVPDPPDEPSEPIEPAGPVVY